MRTCESGSGSKTVGVRVQMWVREGEEQEWKWQREWKWEREWNFQIDVQLCLLLSWQQRRRRSFAHGLWLAHAYTHMRADMHVNIFACICVFKMNFLCLYFATLCIFFSLSLYAKCQIASALCELLRPCVHITLDSDLDLSPLTIYLSLSFPIWMTFPRNLATMCYKLNKK